MTRRTIQWALLANSAVFVLWLASAGASELHDAVKANDLARVQALIAAGADINASDLHSAPLHIAVARGDLEVEKALIDAGADVEIEADGGQYNAHPLHIAAYANQGASAALLIARGAKLEALDSEGKTPLFVATQNGSADVLKILLKAGANPLAEDQDHDTPIHHASGRPETETIELLVDGGVDVNLRSRHNGETALWYAARYDQLEVIRFLLKRGADPNIADNSGVTPIQMAHVSAVKELLRGGGARE